MEVLESENIEYRTVDRLKEKEQIIRHLYPLVTKTISEISTHSHKLIGNLLGYEKELNYCIDVCNSYFKEVKKNSGIGKIRRTMRIHIHSIFKDGSKEPPYPIDITKEDEISDPSKYMTPSSFCVSVEGCLINKVENGGISSKIIDINSNGTSEEQEWKTKEEKEQMGSSIAGVEPREDMSSMNISHVKLSSFFSAVLIILNEETLIYSKQNNNFHNVDKITFSRIAKNRNNTLIKVVLFPKQRIPVFKLSAPFSEFMNTSEATLSEIVKRICEYSMKKGLEGDHGYKTDETLMKLLGVQDYILSDLPLLLSKHISVKAPAVLEHLVELKESEESESIYEIELDRVEPCADKDYSIHQEMNLKENSDKISKILEFIKQSEKELETQEEMRKEEHDLEEFNIMDMHDKINAIYTKKNLPPENVNTNERKQWLKDQGAFALEQIEAIKHDLSEINDEIIDILGEIQKKKKLQLKYEKFVKDPVNFINGLARNIKENSRNSNTDISFLFDDDTNLEKCMNSMSNNDYYKNPWINKGIINYLKVKNKSIEEIARLNKTYNQYDHNTINSFSNFMEDMNINGGNNFTDNMNPLLNPMNFINPMLLMNPMNPVLNMGPINPMMNMGSVNPMMNMGPVNPMMNMGPVNPMMNMGPMYSMMNMGPIYPMMNTNSINPQLDVNSMMNMDTLYPMNPMMNMDTMYSMNPMMNMNSMDPIYPMMNINPMMNMNDINNINGMYPMMNMNDLNKINQMAYMNIENNNENINNTENTNSQVFPEFPRGFS